MVENVFQDVTSKVNIYENRSEMMVQLVEE